MPYLPVEFDALEKCQHIARATEAQPGDVLFGLALTWRDTFRDRRDKWTLDHLRAFFGCKLDVMLPLLVAFGFFEPMDDLYRVRGAARLLHARDAQRAAAAKTNAAKAVDRAVERGAEAVERTVDRTVERTVDPRLTVRSDGALTAYSIQHTAIREREGSATSPTDKSAGPPPPESGQNEKPDKTKRAKPVNSQTPVEGLDNVDRIRRAFAIFWRQGPGDGTEYPDGGHPDRQAARKILDYHRQAKIAEPWTTWAARVCQAYLAIRGDHRLEEDCYPLRYLPSKMTTLVRDVGDRGAPVVKQESANA